jgi:hypothetical protein
MELEITNLEELDPTKIYHIELGPDVSTDTINQFVYAVNKLGLRALITRQGVKFQAFEQMFKDLPDKDKTALLEILTVHPQFEIDPASHENTK